MIYDLIFLFNLLHQNPCEHGDQRYAAYGYITLIIETAVGR